MIDTKLAAAVSAHLLMMLASATVLITAAEALQWWICWREIKRERAEGRRA